LGSLSARPVAFLQRRRRGKPNRPDLLPPGDRSRPELRPRSLRIFARAILDYWLYSTRAFTDVHETIFKEARLAVSLDDKDAMAHAVLALMTGVVGERGAGEWEPAIAEARAAVALSANSAFAMGILGRMLCGGGYHDEAIEELRRAFRASPHDPLTWA